jgi:thioredoxin 1
VSINEWRQEILGNAKPSCVLFYSKWNPKSIEALEIFKTFAVKFEERIVIACTNGDEEAEIDAWYRIIDFPTAIIFKNGAEIGRMAGKQTLEMYSSFVDLE